MFIENADAFWFVSDFLSYILVIKKKVPSESMFAIDLVVSNGKAQMLIKNGSNNVVVKKNYSYTDCPDGTWKFYYDVDSNVMLYYMEY